MNYTSIKLFKKKRGGDFLGPVLKNVPSNVGDTGSIPHAATKI